MYGIVFLIIAVIVIVWQYNVYQTIAKNPDVVNASIAAQNADVLVQSSEAQVTASETELSSVESEILSLGGTLDTSERMTNAEKMERIAALKLKRKELTDKVKAARKARDDAKVAAQVAKIKVAVIKAAVKSKGNNDNRGMHLGQIDPNVEETDIGDPDVMDKDFNDFK